MSKDYRSVWDKFWKDGKGKITVWQTPNLPLIGWFVFMIVAKILDSGATKNSLQFLSTAFLFTWAYLEITSGVSYFRRLLGLVILAGIILSHT
jgi:hypothetical protein